MISCSLGSLAQRRNFINIRIHMQHGKSTFFSCFYNRGSNANPFPELHIAHGTSHSVSVLVDRENKRLPENLGVAGRKQGGTLDAHLPFIGNANGHQHLICATQQVFFSLYPHFFPSILIYHLLKPLSCFSVLPACVLGDLPLPMYRWVAKHCCCCPLWLQGGVLCLASGKWSKGGTQAVW